MSDKLLERLAVAAEGILAHIQKAPASQSGGATAPKAGAAGNSPSAAAAKKAAEDKAAKEAKDKAAAAAAATAAASTKNAPAAGTKAPGGKHTIDQVRDMIRKVAADKNLGKESAKDILRDDGDGVEKVIDLKPAFYDAVYEACEVLLRGEGGKGAPAAAEEDDLM